MEHRCDIKLILLCIRVTVDFSVHNMMALCIRVTVDFRVHRMRDGLLYGGTVCSMLFAGAIRLFSNCFHFIGCVF